MKIIAVAIFTGMLAAGASVKQPSLTSAPAVNVCMDRLAEASTLYLAQVEASKILSMVSVKIAWTSGAACRASDAIRIHVIAETPASLMPGALAFCRPNGTADITVFSDRIRESVAPGIERHLFAYALAHEITHMLEGTARHSETGIMKAHWTPDDYLAMLSGQLPFAPEDVQLVQSGMEAWPTRLEAFSAGRKSSIAPQMGQ